MVFFMRKERKITIVEDKKHTSTEKITIKKIECHIKKLKKRKAAEENDVKNEIILYRRYNTCDDTSLINILINSAEDQRPAPRAPRHAFY